MSNVIAKEAGVPVQAPEMMSIDDFFYKASGAGKPDRVDLLLTLYECYCRLNPEPEQLDDFIFWGDVILGDFDDVDKYLADPGMLFRNVAEFKDIQDSYSYLTETQRKALERFVGNFSRDGRLTVDPGAENPGVKEKFLRIWNLLLPLYNDFRTVLSREGKAGKHTGRGALTGFLRYCLSVKKLWQIRQPWSSTGEPSCI